MDKQEGMSLWRLAELLAQHARLVYGRDVDAIAVKVDHDRRRAEVTLSVALAPQSVMEKREPERIQHQSESI